MMNRRLLITLLTLFSLQTFAAASDVAPAVPDLSLPAETAPVSAPAAAPVQAVPEKKRAAAPAPKKTAARKAPAPRAQRQPAVPAVTNAAAKVNAEEIVVENLMPQNALAAPAPQSAPALAAATPATPQTAASQRVPAVVPAQAGQNTFEPARETAPASGVNNAMQVSYNPPTDRDPTLSPDDTLLLKHREQERLRAIEMERQRKLEAERRRLAELERQRQLELERLRDPSREVRGKIRINGIIGQEVFIGSKVYTVGKSVLGARIVRVLPDSVEFVYKGQKFTKKVQLQ